jgi:hypothetical protein
MVVMIIITTTTTTTTTWRIKKIDFIPLQKRNFAKHVVEHWVGWIKKKKHESYWVVLILNWKFYMGDKIDSYGEWMISDSLILVI